MKDLTFSLCFEPNLESSKEISYVCYDNKIHIRFRDFYKPEIIAGFEKKLTYLITYLFNFSYKKTIIGNYSDKDLIDGFMHSTDMLELLKILKMCDEIDGIKLSINYRKNPNDNTFGSIVENCYPKNMYDNINYIGGLESFLRSIGLDLLVYLFDDRYYIQIKPPAPLQHVNKKFTNKLYRKQNKLISQPKLVELW